jgi:hypothetical protein
MNDNDKYPQLTAFLAIHILPENSSGLPRQSYVSKDGKRKQTEFQPYILVSDGRNLDWIVICWTPKADHHAIEFDLLRWRQATLIQGHRIVTVHIPKLDDVIIRFDNPNDWSYGVCFVVPLSFAEASLSW